MKDPLDVASRSIYNIYKVQSKRRKLEFSLTPKDFRDLIFQPCYYCGIESSNLCGIGRARIKKIPYNGLDRIDNNKGYISHNCLPCCRTCNSMKKSLDYIFFAKHIIRLTEYSKNWIKPLK